MKFIPFRMILIPIFILGHFSLVNANHIILEENFDDYEGQIPNGWMKVDSDGSGVANNFIVQTGKAGNTVSQVAVGELIYPDISWDNYILEFDMISYSGDDRNIVFRWKDIDHRLGFHISGGKLNYEKLIPENEKGGVNNPYVPPVGITTGKMPHNMWHKITITVQDRNIKFHLKNSLVDETLFDYTDYNSNMILNGSIGLRVGSGSTNTSSVWFDNVKVTAIHEEESTNLNIPHFSQLDPWWKDIEYDSSSLYNPIGLREIGDWGCALTSAAMILNYHGYTTTPWGADTTPKTLNTYLIQNNGYTKRGGVIWNKISSFTTHASTHSAYLNKNLPKLEMTYNNYDQALLETDLEATNPAILKLVMKDHNTPRWSDDNLHFVTANGIADNQIFINDPLDLSPTEASLSGKYAQKEIRHMVRFTKSYTDQSYLTIYAYDPNANILVEIDGQKYGVDATGTEYNLDQINYFEEGVIAAPDDFVDRFGDNSSTKVLMIPKPITGNYSLTISNTTETSNILTEIHMFDQEGESTTKTNTYSTTPTNPVQTEIYFDKTDITNSQISDPAVTLESLKNTITQYQSQALIDSKFANRLKNLVNLAIQFQEIDFIKNVFLNRISYLIHKFPDAKISPQARNEINTQIEILKN